jgi:tetratricopeptide (TPR) repeat protein
VGTYRDTDLDRTHPLSAALAELNREQLFERIHLRGLDRAEVTAYVRDTARVEPHPQLLDRLVEETEGNPFFLAEIVRLMTEEGTLSRGGDTADLAIPEGVKEALGRRLDRLSAEANALLALAAVVGREFDHALLHALTAHDDATLLDLLDEALRARVIEEGSVPGAYRFTHALMQETLLGELSAARRVRLHGQIAEALEQLAGANSTERAFELAAHYVESAVLNRDHARQAAHYSRLGAEQAQAQVAWDEAARHYGRCLELVTAHEDRLGMAQDEAALWLELALCRAWSSATLALETETLERALTLWPADDPLGFARAVLRACAGTSTPPAVRSLVPAIDRAVAVLGATPLPEACALLSWKASVLVGPEGDLAAAQAEVAARALGLEGERYPLMLRLRPARVAFDEGRLAEAAAGFEALAAGSGAPSLTDFTSVTPLTHLQFVEWFAGNLERSESAIRQLVDLLRESRLYAARRAGTAWLAYFAWRRGDIAAAEALLVDSPDARLGGGGADLRTELALAAGDVEAALRHSIEGNAPVWEFARAGLLGARCRVLTVSGQMEAARAVFREWQDAFSQTYEPDLVAYVSALNGLDDVLCDFADEPLLRRILDRLGPLTELRNWWCGSGPDYLRGAIELRLGDAEAAERWFTTGLEWATREGVPLVAGRCHQGLAEVAERRGDTGAAREHLDAAGELFARIGARLYLDQVIAKKEILKA